MPALRVLPAPERPQPVKQPSKNQKLKRARLQRHLEQRGDDPDGDLLPLLFTVHGKGQYKAKLLARDPHCIYCRAKITKDPTLEHAIPYAKGGPDAPWNLWLCCFKCNNLKQDRHPLDWLEDLRRACVTMGLLPDADYDDGGDWDSGEATTG